MAGATRGGCRDPAPAGRSRGRSAGFLPTTARPPASRRRPRTGRESPPRDRRLLTVGPPPRSSRPPAAGPPARRRSTRRSGLAKLETAQTRSPSPRRCPPGSTTIRATDLRRSNRTGGAARRESDPAPTARSGRAARAVDEARRSGSSTSPRAIAAAPVRDRMSSWARGALAAARTGDSVRLRTGAALLAGQ